MRKPPIPPLATLEELETASAAALCELYSEVFAAPPPPTASKMILRCNIAWALQARERNQNPVSLREDLIKALKRPSPAATPRYLPGTRLVREWQGDVYEVTVLEKGYHWRGKRYRSLSRIAEEITGTRWSGPRFFGIGGNHGD